MFLVNILLAAIAVILWLLYRTADSFNEDLKQLRLLVAHIERHLDEKLSADTKEKSQDIQPS